MGFSAVLSNRKEVTASHYDFMVQASLLTCLFHNGNYFHFYFQLLIRSYTFTHYLFAEMSLSKARSRIISRKLTHKLPPKCVAVNGSVVSLKDCKTFIAGFVFLEYVLPKYHSQFRFVKGLFILAASEALTYSSSKNVATVIHFLSYLIDPMIICG